MRNAQKGTSYFGILVSIILISMVLKLIFTVWPAYWDDYVVNNQIEEALKSAPSDMTPQSFSADVDDRLVKNNVSKDLHFKNMADVTNTDGLKVAKKYEVRSHFVLNMDLVLTFEKSFDQRSVQAK